MSGFWNRLTSRIKGSRRTHDEFYHRIAQITGLEPVNLSFYQLAMRHSSASKKSESAAWSNNERLEFLGDAILGAVVAKRLYDLYPEENEGFLTSMRAKMVSRKNLNKLAEKFNLAPLVVSRLDAKKPARSLLGDVLEALIGAVYLDLGMEAAERFIESKVMEGNKAFAELETQVVSYKSTLIEYAQAERLHHEFKLEERWGKNHSLNFRVGLYLNGDRVTQGTGTSKKRAEESAAEEACKHFELLKK